MSLLAHLIQVAIVGGTLLAICAILVGLVRADLRENPAKAKLPPPWAGIDALRAYINALDFKDDNEGGADDEPVENDRTPDPDHIRDLQIARELGVA